MAGGPVVIPPGAHVEADPSGQLHAGGQIIDTLQLTDVDDKKLLQKVGNNLYQIDPESNGQEIPPTGLTVEQGYLEAGNVEVVTEMVTMIETQRAFEMYSKMMQGTQAMDEKLITTVGRVNG